MPLIYRDASPVQRPRNSLGVAVPRLALDVVQLRCLNSFGALGLPSRLRFPLSRILSRSTLLARAVPWQCWRAEHRAFSTWALEQEAFAVEPLFEQQRKQLSMLFRVASQEPGYFLRADVGVLGEQPLHQLLQSRFPCVVYGASPMAAAVCDTRCSMAISCPVGVTPWAGLIRSSGLTWR